MFQAYLKILCISVKECNHFKVFFVALGFELRISCLLIRSSNYLTHCASPRCYFYSIIKLYKFWFTFPVNYWKRNIIIWHFNCELVYFLCLLNLIRNIHIYDICIFLSYSFIIMKYFFTEVYIVWYEYNKVLICFLFTYHFVFSFLLP
jgi:hypothetical protein